MKRMEWRQAALSIAVVAIGLSCGGQSPLYEENVTLGAGEGRAFPLERGKYTLELTAEGNGVSVEWIGGSCPRVDQTASLTTTCELPLDGQLVVRNPNTDAPVPVKLTVRRERT